MIPQHVKRISNARQIRFEEFNQDGYMQEQEDLVQLTVGFSNPPDFANFPLDEFYSKAMQNVKMTFVNLKRLRLEGGYIYRASASEEVSFLLFEGFILCF